ncbi:helix-turn-helix domain-containing protein [Paraburkholderia kururiensis]|uniref:helix-turn-helix domain-containing protein n=1 Tax=Paraburkholderia kururiensis TaxID=984307 RepID=UPI001F0B8904|nr:AraC family transcriptional regulator [Paraburkholderia kururiensis]
MKIAADLQQALAMRVRDGAAGRTTARHLAAAEGWRVDDVLCTFGPRDQPFEERHGSVCIAVVAAGSFGYRSEAGRELMTPGSLMLGNAGACFECGHRHGAGDRCLSFHYTPAWFERLAADLGVRSGSLAFRATRVPPTRRLAPLVARAMVGAAAPAGVAWHELAVQIAAVTLAVMNEHEKGRATSHASRGTATAWSRVAQTVQLIEATPGEDHTLATLAARAGVSEFYFLRTFSQVTGITPHQYVLRTRLRAAALRLRRPEAGGTTVLDIALDCGFNDVSNFNHAFRAEFGMSPRAWRAAARGPSASVSAADAVTAEPPGTPRA